MNTKDYLKSLAQDLEDYIAEKKQMQQIEKSAGRGVGLRSFLQPKNLFLQIGSTLKNPDNQTALLNRAKNVAHAEYLLNIVNNVKNDDLSLLNYEMQRQKNDVGLDQEGSYYKLINKAQHAIPADTIKQYSVTGVPVNKFPMSNVIALWPYFLAAKGANKSAAADYGLDQLLKLAAESTDSFDNNIHDFFEAMFEKMGTEVKGILRATAEDSDVVKSRVQLYQTQAYARGYLVYEQVANQSRAVTRGLQEKLEIKIMPPFVKDGVINPSVDQWCDAVLNALNTRVQDNANNHIFIVEKFPPQAYAYYQALQEKIAVLIPDEPARPNIIIQVQGEKIRTGEIKKTAHVGFLGGTGPLSDAQMMHGWLEEACKDKDSVEEVSAVLFSFPPPRPALGTTSDIYLTVTHTSSYASLMQTYTGKYPAYQHLLLSNTAHCNLGVAQKIIHSKSGPVFDMVSGIVHGLKDAKGVLVLGTTAAAVARLYPKKLEARNIPCVLPNEQKQTQLQYFIDAVKKGNAADVAPKFIVFVIELAKTAAENKLPMNQIILSCTELPLLLSEKMPNGNGCYADELNRQLKENNLDIKIIDTEEEFIHYMHDFEVLPRSTPSEVVNKILQEPSLAVNYFELEKRIEFIKGNYQNANVLIEKWIEHNKHPQISLYYHLIVPLIKFNKEEKVQNIIDFMYAEKPLSEKIEFLKTKRANIAKESESPLNLELLTLLGDEIKAQEKYAYKVEKPPSPEFAKN